MSNFIPRIELQSCGWWVLQNFDVNDPNGAAYDRTNWAGRIPGNYAARYTFGKTTSGVSILQQVANTQGPVTGFFNWPATAPRIMGQWAQVFPAKITSTSPLKAAPVATGNGSGWVTDTTGLTAISVLSADGSTPDLNSFGLVIVGTETGAQNPLWFSGSTKPMGWYSITGNNSDGSYAAQQYNYPDIPGGATVIGGGVTIYEMNKAILVPNAQWVQGQLASNGKVYFNMPFGC